MDKDGQVPVANSGSESSNAQTTYSDYSVIPSSGICELVKCRKGDQWVVLKGLKETYRGKTPYHNLLKKEYQTARNLNHPHVVRYLDFIDHPEYGKCIVLEYVEGRSLKSYITENHTSAEKKEVVDQIADALAYIHQKQVVHRNLKPSNILLTQKDDQVKLIDFRVSYIDDLSEPASSLKYAAPEQRDGTMTIDGRADIYALGMVMKDMGLYNEYASVIDKCCSFGRSERYFDIEAFLKDLNHEGSEGGSRKKTAALVAIIAVAVIVVAVFLFSRSGFTSSSGDNTETASALDSTDTVAQTSAPEAAPATTSEAPQTDTTQAATDAASGAMGGLDEAMKAKMTSGLDRIFQVYFAQKQRGNLDRIQMRKDIKNYYRSFLRTQKVTSDQREAFDAAFAAYVKQKTDQLNS